MAEKLLLAGCGKMGGALLSGWLQRGVKADDVSIVEPSNDIRTMLTNDHGVHTYASIDEIPSELQPNVVMLAVKPQAMDDVAALYSRYKNKNCVFLSIAAGKTVDYFTKHLGKDAAIVRSMPNTPAAVQRGITVCYANANTLPAQRDMCDNLLQAVGSVDWVDDEGMIDAVTALSGGGPAYVFLLAECLAQAGIDAGLPADLAGRLARETVAGSGELLHQSHEDATQLRINVTSPGGTTAEALRVLMACDGWQPLISKAIKAATERSRELAG